MSYIPSRCRFFTVGLMLAMLSAIMLFGFTHVVSADQHGFRGHEFVDSRYNHNHYYPARGHFVDELPRGHHVVVHGGTRFFFFGGVWYRPYGTRFEIIAPPFGIVVPFLPPYYTTIWVGGIPYYYANEVYYVQNPGGYMVVEPPQGEVVQAPPPVGQLFIYPRKGQNEQQQANDRYECHRWSSGQTGYDPTQPPGGMPQAQMTQKYADYKRAMSACLDGRGYTVK
ncbi:MAG: DUF6515 family protein [Syntrophales bacterium]